MARMAGVAESWRIAVRLGRRREARAVEDEVRSRLGPTVGRDGKTVFADAGNWPQAEHMRTVVERVLAEHGLGTRVEVWRDPGTSEAG
jgi:hypothetical protein